MSASHYDIEGTLNYQIPTDLPGRIRKLCELMRLPYERFAQLPEEQAVELLAGVILFHHLPENGPERRAVWEAVLAAPGPLIPLLSNKILDPKVNPQWGIWAMDTQELFELLDTTSAISEIGSALGMTASIPTLWTILENLGNSKPPKAQARARAGVVLTLLIWGFFVQNSHSHGATQEELFRRGARR
ncbi:MAG: hypothetical protein ACK4KV_08425 [Rhodocyclaceae bacterium]